LSRSAPRVPDVLAAVDLGSNSFHLVVARYSGGQLIVIDRMREMVRLAAGIGEDGRLDRDVAARALACLARFGQRLSDVHADGVRVVGTSALRVARRTQSFLERAREALGHPIEVVSGREEARLIYSGVAHTLPDEPGRRLVVDIGGGSTELIIGQGLEPLQLESVKLGCVSKSSRYFGDGRLTAKRFQRARLSARQELESIQQTYRRLGWDSAAGSSGTVRAVFEAQRELDPKASMITLEGVEAVIGQLVRDGHVSAIQLESITDERRAVFPGGIAILAEVLGQLDVGPMRVAEGAMREGLLYDMLGRYTHEDARERTVRSMQQRYHVDLAQAARVEATAVGFLAMVRDAWSLHDPLAELSLRWAARLHEIGLDVAHSGYHRHGAYLLENADMPGFAREEQQVLARIVGAHRRKLELAPLEELVRPWDMQALYLVLLLRLAVLLHRSRSEAPLPEITLAAKPRTLEMRFRLRSFRDQPLTAADLNDEIDFLRVQGLRLRVFTS
jgi:exopolyphosphatase/guanosine-5'-triphosphate,3'-diphosphate pyrophosphatase